MCENIKKFETNRFEKQLNYKKRRLNTNRKERNTNRRGKIIKRKRSYRRIERVLKKRI